MKSKASKFFATGLAALSVAGVCTNELHAESDINKLDTTEAPVVLNDNVISDLFYKSKIDQDSMNNYLAFGEVTDPLTYTPSQPTPVPYGPDAVLKKDTTRSSTGPSSEACVQAHTKFTNLYESTTTAPEVCSRGADVKQAYYQMTEACEVSAEEQQQGLQGMDTAIAQACGQ
jgi:hypothetical protein